MPSEIIDEGYEISAPSDAHVLCRSPYIRVDQIELIPAPISIIGEWKSVPLPELVGFADLAISATKFRQSENDILCLRFSKLWEVDMAEPLVP